MQFAVLINCYEQVHYGIVHRGEIFVRTDGVSLIAVIDDDSPFLDLLRDLLEGEGYRVTVGSVSDGTLALLHAAPPNLMVLDFIIGTERAADLTLLRTLQVDPQLAWLPMSVASAATDLLTTHVAEFERLDAVTLAKPCDLYHPLDYTNRMTGAARCDGQKAGIGVVADDV